MLSVMSWSPQLMKIFVPVILYEPSSCGTALVFTCPGSEPHCGSVRHIVPVHSPEIMRCAYLSTSSFVPCDSSVLIAPLDRPGYITHVQFAAAAISVAKSARLCGRPCPPRCSGYERPCQPPSTNLS